MFRNPLEPSEKHPLLNLIIILLSVALGFVVLGPLLGAVASMPFYEGSLIEFGNAYEDPVNHPEIKIPLYIIQGLSTFVGLILAPIWYLSQRQRSVSIFFREQKTSLLPVIITAVAVVVFMAVNSVFIEWNAKVHFPDFAKGFENWARDLEDRGIVLTEFLTKFENEGQVLLALVVIAVLPAIGEEIVFRGLIQNELLRATKNIHISIWITAILFSAIHFQFFGFVPRMFLGVLFGYIYYWSGNLTYAIIAHFINNGLSVIAIYFYQQGKLPYNVDNAEAAPASVVIFSAVLTATLLYYFYQYFAQRKNSPSL